MSSMFFPPITFWNRAASCCWLTARPRMTCCSGICAPPGGIRSTEEGKPTRLCGNRSIVHSLTCHQSLGHMGPEASPPLTHEDESSDHPVTPQKAECLMMERWILLLSLNAQWDTISKMSSVLSALCVHTDGWLMSGWCSAVVENSTIVW